MRTGAPHDVGPGEAFKFRHVGGPAGGPDGSV
jgi:hypothetical protein